ncbi:MAG TPA: hypothetical protein ENI97_15285 [Gammaproteobacteria bacterium]|nr:hypothetical protein [Gammaproteobacteria bacterium]
MTTLTRHTNRTVPACVLGLLTGLIGPPTFAEGSPSVSLGYEYTTGKYGQNVDTSIVSIPVTMNIIRDAWRYTLTVPYISVTGNGTVIPGTGGAMTFENFSGGFFGGGGGGGMMGSSTQTVTNSGLGDVVASAAYGFFPEQAFYEVSAKIKFATADADKGLGTGENDYYFQLDGLVGTDTAQPFFTLGYVITGDPAGFSFKDVPYGSLGLMIKTGASSSLGLSYDYRQSSVSGSDDVSQASVFIDWETSTRISLGLSATTGFSDSSPDAGFGLNLSRRF